MAVQGDTENSKTIPHSKTLTNVFKVGQTAASPVNASLTDDGIIVTQKSTIRPLLHAKRHGHAPIVSSWDVLVHVFFCVGVSTPYQASQSVCRTMRDEFPARSSVHLRGMTLS